MKRAYWTPGHECIAQLQLNGDGTAEILRVKTAPGFRKQGFGNQVMTEVMEDADREGVELLLVSGIGEEGGLSGAELDEWYARLGFDAISPGGYPGTTLMQRVPGAPRWRSG